MVGWSSLLDYLFLPMINVLLAKIYLSALFPEVPPWVWVVTFVAILTAANLKSVNGGQLQYTVRAGADFDHGGVCHSGGAGAA